MFNGAIDTFERVRNSLRIKLINFDKTDEFSSRLDSYLYNILVSKLRFLQHTAVLHFKCTFVLHAQLNFL